MPSDDLGPVLSLERAEVRTGTLVVDAPARSGLPPVVDATADAAVVRFHGRNDENWDKRGISAAERFD